MLTRFIPLLVIILVLTACSNSAKTIQQTQEDGAPGFHLDASDIVNAKPHYIPQSQYGNPESYLVNGKRYFTTPSAKGFKQRGIASWYGTKFHSRLTSSGEPYDMLAMTAAHKTLPLPTFVKVTNLKTGQWIIVKVNDRGPFKEGRIIDLSYAAAVKLGMAKHGTAPVEVVALPPFNEPSRDRYALPYMIQYGAFKQKANADRFLHQLQDKTEYNNLSIERHGNLYLVRGGPYPNAKAADQHATQAKWLGYKSAYIVQQRDDS